MTAAAALTALVRDRLVTRDGAALIFIGSIAGHTAFPHNAAYVASKHGLTGLARASWLDLRVQGVKVSLISPGLVAAGSGLESPQGRRDPGNLLTPSDIVSAVGYVLDSPQRCCPTEIRLEPHVG